MSCGVRWVVVGAVLAWMAASPAWAQGRRGPAPAPDAGGVAVLDTFGFWRTHHTLRPPMLTEGGALKPALLSQKWLNMETPPPPANWKDAAFDDGNWVRATAPNACRTPYLARLCLRGKFTVTNPGRVRDLTLSMTYNGGAAVYLNGKEVATDRAVAGKGGEMEYSDKAPAKPMAGLAVPANLLRPGVNVLAIEIVRPPFAGALAAGKDPSYKLPSDTCVLNRVRLSAGSVDGLVSSAARPAGLQVWNSDVLTSDTDLDFGNPAEPLRPVTIVGARGGAFSGKVVAGSPKPLEGLKATAGELKSPTGVIPASAVTIRYALPWGVDPSLSPRGVQAYPGRFNRLSALSEVPPASAAVVPVWITVNVPRNAKPGTYTGAVHIEAAHEKPVTATVSLKVAAWTVPAPQDFRTWVETIQSPDTVSVEYNVPLWSDKHFELMGRSFQRIHEIGSRVLHIPLIAHTNLGNAESMVRWVKKGPNRYDFDLSAMEKYVDLAVKNMGRPKIIVLQVWDIYMSSKESAGKRFGEGIDLTGHTFLNGPQVTVVDRVGGEPKLESLPKLSDPASRPLWGALLNQVREKLKKRNLDKAVMYGLFTDACPTKEDVQFFKGIFPDVPWVQQGHGLYNPGQKVQQIGELGYQATVWGAKFCDSVPTHGTTDSQNLHGWSNRQLAADFERNTALDNYPSTRWRQFAEQCVTGNMRGMGRLGADYWRAVKDRTGKRVGHVHDRYPEGSWGQGGIYLNLCNPVLAPAPQGPVATQHFEMFREGIQECEARIYIEQALMDPGRRSRLPADLAKRCQDALEERIPIMWKSLSNHQLIGSGWGDARLWRWTENIAGHVWFVGSGWQERSEKLYTLAAEVAAKIGK